MKRTGDAASAAALAAHLARAAAGLSAAADESATDVERAREAQLLADVMTRLARALDDFAVGLRAPAPPRSGLPHPHTALTSACVRLSQDLARTQPQSRTQTQPQTQASESR